MNYFIAIALIFGVLLIASSWSLYLRPAPNKDLRDHTARTMVQIGLGVTAMIVAFTVFMKNVEENDERARSQMVETLRSSTLMFNTIKLQANNSLKYCANIQDSNSRA